MGIPLNPQQHVDGNSLLPLLQGENIDERTLYWHYPHYGNQGGEPSTIVREGNWKLIHYWEDGRNELYNLALDIGEQNDVANENIETVERLKNKMESWLTETNANLPIPDPAHNIELDKARDVRIKNELLPRLDKERKDMLSPGWQPNADWWGSKVTID